MNQNLVSNLTLRIEQEKQMMSAHQADIELFQQNTSNLLWRTVKEFRDFQQDVQNTTQTATSHLVQTQQNLGLIETESLNLLNTLKEQVQQCQLLQQQSQALQQQAQQLIISTQNNSTQQKEQIKHIKYMLIAVISLLILLLLAVLVK